MKRSSTDVFLRRTLCRRPREQKRNSMLGEGIAIAIATLLGIYQLGTDGAVRAEQVHMK